MFLTNKINKNHKQNTLWVADYKYKRLKKYYKHKQLKYKKLLFEKRYKIISKKIQNNKNFNIVRRMGKRNQT